MELSQREFIQLKSGDPVVFEKVYQSYKDRVYGYVMLLCGNDVGIANEIFSNTIFSAFRSVHTMKNGNNVLQWFLRIAKNRYIDHLRRLHRENKLVERLKPDVDGRHAPDPADTVMEEDQRRLLDLALENVKPAYREVIRYKYFDRLSHEEIAEKMDKSLDASESLLHRAISAVRKEFRKLAGYA